MLPAAGVALEVEGRADQVPRAQQQTAAWFVRETITNVLRHSSATRVTITLSASGISVHNDGITGAMGPLNGLEALRRRAGVLGARILIDHQPPTFTADLRFNADEEETP